MNRSIFSFELLYLVKLVIAGLAPSIYVRLMTEELATRPLR